MENEPADIAAIDEECKLDKIRENGSWLLPGTTGFEQNNELQDPGPIVHEQINLVNPALT